MTDDTKPRLTPQHTTGYYDCWLPVYKQGDDLFQHLGEEETPAAAFEALAERYEGAAAMCRRLVGVAREMPELRVDADCHHIGVSGPVERMEALVTEGLLQSSDFEEFRESIHDCFTDTLIDDREGKGPFSEGDAIQRAPQLDTELADLNPVWVLETLAEMVEQGSLRKVADKWEVIPEEIES